MLYKYPQAPFPYAELVEVNRSRSTAEEEYELMETGVFDDDRYFDVLVEYAKGDVDDILLNVQVTNHGSDAHPVTVIVQLWFRNEWKHEEKAYRPSLYAENGRVHVDHPEFEVFGWSVIPLRCCSVITRAQRRMSLSPRIPFTATS